MTEHSSTTTSLIDINATPEKKKKTLKILIFQVGKLQLGLSVDFVKKIIRGAEIHGSGTTEMGITQINNQDITVIDLHRRLFKQSQSLEGMVHPFLILAKNTIDEVFGILVGETPTLIDVPFSNIRVLPDSYRRGDTLEIATHVAKAEENGQGITVFILDVDKLVPPIALGDFVF
ncbi:MAG: chemotaxis protein CheW [Microcystaceae cyanobacterium]